MKSNNKGKKIEEKKQTILNETDQEKGEKKLRTEVDIKAYFMTMIKSILKFLPLGLGFYDELSDFIYYKNAKFIDQELKNIFFFFLFLSPAIQMTCWMILFKKIDYRNQLKFRDYKY